MGRNPFGAGLSPIPSGIDESLSFSPIQREAPVRNRQDLESTRVTITGSQDLDESVIFVGTYGPETISKRGRSISNPPVPIRSPHIRSGPFEARKEKRSVAEEVEANKEAAYVINCAICLEDLGEIQKGNKQVLFIYILIYL